MRRLFVLCVMAFSLALLPAPAAADTIPGPLPCTPVASGGGSATCSINGHGVTLPFFPGPCVPSVLAPPAIVGVTGNAVFHVIQNTAGDFWITTTDEGTLGGLPNGYSGRATQWFGLESNLQNSVLHFISDGSLTAPDGTVTAFHETGHVSISANGQESVVFDNCTN